MITRQAIVDKAREYLDTPFHHLGRQKGVGIDCIGLAICVAQELGLSWDEEHYDRHPKPGLLLRRLRETLQEKPLNERLPGDLVVFWIRHTSDDCHCGIVTDRGFVHTYYDPNRVNSRVTEVELVSFWEERLLACFKYPEVID